MMVPDPCTTTAYQRALAKRGPALHIDALPPRTSQELTKIGATCTVWPITVIPTVCTHMNIHAAPEATATSRLSVPEPCKEHVNAREAPLVRHITWR
jgi:hypothetical protein